jgi:hypothetical protein
MSCLSLAVITTLYPRSSTCVARALPKPVEQPVINQTGFFALIREVLTLDFMAVAFIGRECSSSEGVEIISQFEIFKQFNRCVTTRTE